MRRIDPGLLGLLVLLGGALVIGVVRFGLNHAGPAPEAQNLAEVMGPTADADAFARVTGPRPLEFPADHGAHPDYRTEWWYFTGNLTAANGAAYGFQLTLFRTALAPEAGDERSSKTAQDFIKLIDSRRSYYTTIAARKEDAIDYYQPYPPIQ